MAVLLPELPTAALHASVVWHTLQSGPPNPPSHWFPQPKLPALPEREESKTGREARMGLAQVREVQLAPPQPTGQAQPLVPAVLMPKLPQDAIRYDLDRERGR